MKIYNLPQTIKAIIFDIDSTLYTNRPYAFEQVDCQVRAFAKMKGISSSEARKMVADYRKQFAAEHNGSKVSLGNTLKAFGIPIKQSVKWRKKLLEPSDYLYYDESLVNEISLLSDSYKLICVTNNPVLPARKTLDAIGVSRFFPDIVGLDTCLKSKPAEEPFKLAVELKNETGVDIKFINLSGGVGVPYTPDKEPNDILAIGEGVKKVFEEILVPAGMGDVSIYTELGRFMLAPYGHLVTTAIHEKHIYKEYIGVDACAVNLMRPAMYGAYHHITVLGKENAPCDHVYDVTGSLCENNDKFAIDRKLPKIDMGDILVIHDTGAHGFAMGYNYNGKLKSAELLLREDGSVIEIRRPETVDDYFATLDGYWNVIE